MTKTVNSVLGPISVNNLGKALVHVHLVCGVPGWQYDSAAPRYNREAVEDLCVAAISEAKVLGLQTIIDPLPNDAHRDIVLYQRVASRTGVNIICATGFYLEEAGASAYYKSRQAMFGFALGDGARGRIIDEMRQSMLQDLTVGIDDSGAKAGVIKIATGHGKITEYEKMVMEAAVLAQRETGVPILTHTENGTMGPEQAEFMISRGADPKRLMIGHMCGNADIDYHLGVLKRNAFDGFDRIGIDGLMPDATRCATIAELVKRGYVKQIMLSSDCVLHWLGRTWPPIELQFPGMENCNLTHIFTGFSQALQDAGVTKEQLHTMLVENPRRLFADGNDKDIDHQGGNETH